MVHILANSIGNSPAVQETLGSIVVEAQASFEQTGLSVTLVVVGCHSFNNVCQYVGQLPAFASNYVYVTISEISTTLLSDSPP